MEACVIAEMEKMGYKVNTTPYSYIRTATQWYQNEVIDNFHKRTSMSGEEYEIDRMGFAKLGCEDDANLCEVIDICVGEKPDPEAKEKIENESTKNIKKLLSDNRFDVQYRKQLELMSATGTVAAYIWLQDATYLDNGKVTGGKVRIAYCKAENYIPLTVVNGEVIEAAFSGTNTVKGKKRTTLVVFRLSDGLYRADTFTYDENNKPLNQQWVQLGDKKPFSVMQVAQVNNIDSDNMDGFGLPKVYKSIPTLKILDLCHMILSGDLSKGEKVLLASDSLIPLDDNTGKPKKLPILKKIFVFLGKDLPEEKDLVKEYNPEIRIEQITKCFELALSLFSMMFGFGTKKYTFENGQVTTATEYIGERQDSMQELNKQRKSATDYITDIVRAIEWFSNTFCSTSYDLKEDILIDFDDSFIEDKNTKIENMRADAQTFSDIPEFTIRYIQERLNVTRKEAENIFNGREQDEDPETAD